MNFYRVKFCTKRGVKGFRTWYFIDISASNLVEARAIVERMWYSVYKKHMFSVDVKRLKTLVLAEWFSLCEEYDV